VPLWFVLVPLFAAPVDLDAVVAQAGNVTIEVPVFEGGEGLDFFIECAERYQRHRPNVTVNLYGDPRIADKVRIRCLEGTFPEASNAAINYWPLIANGDILALDPYLEGPNWEGDSTWRDSFMPGVLDVFEQDGKTYGMPFFYSVFVIWYNKTMFEEHGWETPETWDEFFALCDQVQAEGIPPMTFQGRYLSYAQPFIDAAYYHLAGPERYWQQKEHLAEGSFDNPEMVESLDIALRCKRYFQKGAMGMTHTESQREFFLGHAAMIPCGTWLKSEMIGKIPEGFRLGCFRIPYIPTGKADQTAIPVGTNYYFVFSGSAHPEVAVDFYRFMTSREMGGLFAQMRDFPVAIQGANEGHLTPDMDDLLDILNTTTTVYGRPPGEGYPEFEQYLTDRRADLFLEKASPEEVAAALERDARIVVERAADPTKVTIQHWREPVILIALIVGAVGYSLVIGWRRIRFERVARREKESSLRMRWPSLLLFLGPSVALYTAFVVVPCLKSFRWSLYQWDGLTDMKWFGLVHFKRLLFESDVFWIALRNNLFIMLVVPVFVLPLSLFLAACLSRRLPGSAAFRIVFFFPNILGVVAATLIWGYAYNANGGLVNGALVGIGNGLLWLHKHVLPLAALESWGAGMVEHWSGFAWLSPDHLYWALVPMSIWSACGFNLILFLAAMESVPTSLYEAADLDGASAWRQFWTITLPLIWDVLAIAIVFMVIGGMKAFEVIWLLTNQQPISENHVIGTYMVTSMFSEFKVGQATAIAVILFLIVFFGSIATLRMMQRERVEY
jgi:ABC-type sugar transport system permease subunit/ABC-type glycerol-3-phosphate transport system substrate-binding protein